MAEAKNCYLSRSGTWTQRPGYKALFKATGGCGVAEYKYIAASSGAVSYEKLIMGAQLQKIAVGTLAMTYSGAALSIVCSVLYDTSAFEWKFYLIEDDVTTFTYSLGVGFDESSPITMSTLATAIDALSTFACTNTGSGSIPAAFLPTIVTEPFSGGALTLFYEYETSIYQTAGSSNPFLNHISHRNETDYEMLSTCNINNIIYFVSPYDEEKKYDGQKIYRSGMPQPGVPTAAVVANATGRTGTNIRYRVSFVQVDKQNNRQEGIISDQSNQVSPAADYVDVTYARIAVATGFNTDCAMVVANQTGVNTINVDDGVGGPHTLKVGDVAYFLDGVTASYVERTITAIATNTITISGNAVNVLDNAPISANLRVSLYAQSVLDGDYYYIQDYPHNSWLVVLFASLCFVVLRDFRGLR